MSIMAKLVAGLGVAGALFYLAGGNVLYALACLACALFTVWDVKTNP